MIFEVRLTSSSLRSGIPFENFPSVPIKILRISLPLWALSLFDRSAVKSEQESFESFCSIRSIGHNYVTLFRNCEYAQIEHFVMHRTKC